MWYPCNCSDCEQEEFYPKKNGRICNMPQIPLTLQAFFPFKKDSNHQQLVQNNNLKNVILRKSSTVGVLPTKARPPRPPLPQKCLLQIEGSEGPPPSIIQEESRDIKVPSKSKLNSDSVEEYSPADSLEDGRPPLKSEQSETWNESVNGITKSTNGSVCRKNKYSNTILKPDSSLPPVIRRRNQNIRKKLAVSIRRP